MLQSKLALCGSGSKAGNADRDCNDQTRHILVSDPVHDSVNKQTVGFPPRKDKLESTWVPVGWNGSAFIALHACLIMLATVSRVSARLESHMPRGSADWSVA